MEQPEIGRIEFHPTTMIDVPNQIEVSSIVGRQIREGTLTTALIADNAVTYAKIGQIAACRAWRNSAQTISHATATSILFDNEDYDSVGFHSTSANTDRFTALYAGVYTFGFSVGFDGNATGVREFWINKNGASTSTIRYAATNDNAPIATNVASCIVQAQLLLDVNDYVVATVFQSSGGNLNTAYSSGVEVPSAWFKYEGPVV